jgi:hypothetical protein
MWKTFLAPAAFLALPAFLSPAASAQQISAQQETARFVCTAPAGHVCQFRVRTAAGPVDFALPSGERREVAGIAPYKDKYCVCDPGPVTPNCKAPQLDHWCLGDWLDVTRDLNSQNDVIESRFAVQ